MQLWGSEAPPHEAWLATFGSVMKYRGFLGADILSTTDTRAISHIVNHTNVYNRAAHSRFFLSLTLGNSILALDGEEHHRQRKIMSPAFGPAQIRNLTEIFVNKSCELRDLWACHLSHSSKDSARIDICQGLTKMALDAIGLAGFNHDFDSLGSSGHTDPLFTAFLDIQKYLPSKPKIHFILCNSFPLLRKVPSAPRRGLDKAVSELRAIGSRLLADMKRNITEAQQVQTAHTDQGVDGNTGLTTLRDRDLLTLLVQANMRTDLPDSQRLSDNDVIDQIRTFLFAGHETTGTIMAWCLYSLSQAPEVQQKLRDELWELPSGNPTMDELQALPHLDMVVRETLRVHAPIALTHRVATKDDVIPLEIPLTDIIGQVHHGIRIQKGTLVEVPILAVNRSKEIWGEDALEFRPDRWRNIPDAAKRVPGAWGNMMTFLGGPRACIGYRFSLVEMKALLFILIRAFEFEMAIPADCILKGRAGFDRPMVRGEEERGAQMPLIIRLHKHKPGAPKSPQE